MADCVRGCTVYHRHVTKCPVPDRSAGAWVPLTIPGMTGEETREAHFDGDLNLIRPDWRHAVWVGRYGGLETWHDCHGCQPRTAMEHRRVCEHCHDRLTEWLASLGWLYGWLSENIPPGNTAGARQDWQLSATSDGTPAPLRVSVLDARILLTDRVMELEDCARDVFDRPARQRFTLRAAVDFLTAWLSRIEDDPDLVVHMFELLEDLFRRSRQLVPWEDRPRRISGIICPHCERTTLEVKPGSEDVSCRTCNAVIPKEKYLFWIRVLAEEAKASA